MILAALLQKQFDIDVRQWTKAKTIAQTYQDATTDAHKQVATDYGAASDTLWTAAKTTYQDA